MMIALVLVLPVEVVLLSLRFSAQSLKHTPGLAANLIRLMPVAVHAMIAVACGIALIALVRRDEVGPPIREALERPHRRRFAWTLAHAALIVPFYVLTAHLIEGTAAAGPRGELLVVAWLGLGVIWGLSWCGLLLSDSAWAILARRLWPIAAIGASVGLAGLAVSLVAPRLWAPLTAVTFGSVRGLLEAVGSEVVSIPAESILGTERFRVRIGPSCSGYEGIGLMAGYLAALMIALRHRLRFPRAWLLLPLGLGAIWAANVARIAALILIGDQISPAIAKGGFHSQAGWLAFNAVSLTLLLVAVLSPWFVRIEKDREVGADLVLSPTSAYLMPFLVLIAASMVTGAMSAGFDRLYAVRMLACFAALAAYRRSWASSLAGVSWAWSIGVGVAVFALWMALEPLSGAGPEAGRALQGHVDALGTGERLLWILSRVLGSVLIVPLAEELAFRGYGLRRLSGVDFERVDLGRVPPLALLLSSLLFGALHGRWFAGTLAGLAFGWVYVRRGRLADAVLAHATANALIALWVLALGAWSLWC